MQTLKEKLDDAKSEACRESYKHGCVQHVEPILDDGLVVDYRVDDWASPTTVASYENGRQIFG